MKSERIQLTLTREQKREIEKEADKLGISVASFLRMRGLKKNE